MVSYELMAEGTSHSCLAIRHKGANHANEETLLEIYIENDMYVLVLA